MCGVVLLYVLQAINQSNDVTIPRYVSSLVRLRGRIVSRSFYWLCIAK
jgi:hypothetical protein